MRRQSVPLLFTILLSSFTSGQTPTASAPPPAAASAQPRSTAPTIQARTNLVIEDVVVKDRAGKPVHGLQLSDFTVFEQGKPQQIRSFDEHAAAPLPPIPPPLDLPQGVFTNYTAIPPAPEYNVLLFDMLNTALQDQAFARQQILKYIRSAPPGQRLAIFGLTTRLILLQGFTSDPAILRAAVDKKLVRSSTLLDNASVGGSPQPLSNIVSNLGASNGVLAEVAANNQQFEADTAAFQLQSRARYTLDALDVLARYLSTLPGRKNVLWFSGSFPLNIFPDSTLKDAFRATADLSDDLKQTANVLTHARVAVYPIDARGLFNDPTFDASNSGQNLFQPGGAMAAMQRFNQQTASEHATLLEIARQTGGHAFINTNGLAEAVAQAIDEGSNFYTLSYTPTDTRLDSTFRKISLRLQGPHAAEGLSLSYRIGYFAVDPDGGARRPLPAPTSTAAAPVTAPPPASGALRAAMLRGGPPSTDLLFKVSVRPSAAPASPPEPTAANNNQPNPKLAHPPFRNYTVDYAAFPSQLLTRGEGGNYLGSIRFIILAYNADGDVVNLVDQTTQADLAPDLYTRTVHGGLLYRQIISVPVKGDYFLRIGVYNPVNDRVGSIEVPVAAVRNLPPPAPANSHSATP